MPLRKQIKTDLAAAMRANDATLRDTLRLVLAAIQQVEVDEQITLDEDGVLAVLQRQAKQRRESVADYERAGRPEQAALENAELAVIQRYLPQPLGETELRDLAAAVIADLGVTDNRGMGQVMGRMMAQVKGKADGRLVNQIVRDLLS